MFHPQNSLKSMNMMALIIQNPWIWLPWTMDFRILEIMGMVNCQNNQKKMGFRLFWPFTTNGKQDLTFLRIFLWLVRPYLHIDIQAFSDSCSVEPFLGVTLRMSTLIWQTNKKTDVMMTKTTRTMTMIMILTCVYITPSTASLPPQLPYGHHPPLALAPAIPKRRNGRNGGLVVYSGPKYGQVFMPCSRGTHRSQSQWVAGLNEVPMSRS